MANKIKASHILIPKYQKAMQLYEEIQSGKDFATLARNNSTCPSRKKGGNLGEFGRGQMVKEFEQVAFSLKVNQVSEPVKTKHGYHIIKRTK
ncbi:MAG: peptidylprolyl isomerase [Candidatus Kariarchaeaceae archaeon]|jgi:peptidyl-prolyl cis-trans isomerase C